MHSYTAEIAPPHIRGRATSTLNTGIAVGILVAYWVQYGALNITGNGAWRLCFALQLLPGAAVGVLMLFRPESPRWLLQVGREDEAAQILSRLHGNGDASNALVRIEVAEIKAVVELESASNSPSYWALLSARTIDDGHGLPLGHK